MILVKPSFKLELDGLTGQEILEKLERIGRISHKSEGLIEPGSAAKFIGKWAIGAGHSSILRHHSVTVHMVCNRAVSHQIVRHGLADFLQESQRYCCYGEHVAFVIPNWAVNVHEGHADTRNARVDLYHAEHLWLNSVQGAAADYLAMLRVGLKPEQAREVLPNSTKTELYITANLEEWRHIFKARCSKHADPAMREIMLPMLDEFKKHLPVVFDDLFSGQ